MRTVYAVQKMKLFCSALGDDETGRDGMGGDGVGNGMFTLYSMKLHLLNDGTKMHELCHQVSKSHRGIGWTWASGLARGLGSSR